MNMYGRLIFGTILCIVQAIPTQASYPNGGSSIKLSQAFQPASAIPVLGHVMHPFYIAARTSSTRRSGGVVTFSDLFNGESVTMPSWLWEEVKDLNEQLKECVSASDYLTILKGEHRLFGRYRTKGDYLRAVSQNRSPLEDHINTVQELRQKLGEILANPTSDQIFPRPRFIERGKKGVMFLEHLRYSHDSIAYADESYILGMRQLSVLRESWLWSFWDSRTGIQKTQFVCPVYVPVDPKGGSDCVFGRKIGKNPVYCIEGQSVEAYCSAGDWSRTCDAELYLVAPEELMFQATALNRPEFGEKPETGSLYKMSKPIPKPMYGSEKIVKPWYTGKESGIELYHIPTQKNELDFAWGREHIPQEGNILFLDSLSQYSRTNEQKGDDAKLIKDKIVRLMQPAPRDSRNDELQIDVGSTREGYTLFLRYYTHYYEATDGGGLMFGLLTPKDEILCFPIGEKEPESGQEWSLLLRTGRLCSYSQCIDQRAKIDKMDEGRFKKDNPGKPYVILKLSEGYSPNISGAYYTNDTAPYILTFSANSLGDGKHLELAVGLEYEGIVELDIVRLNMEDLTYVIDKSWRFPKITLLPKWISNQRIFMRPERDFQYKIIQVEEDGSDRVLGDLYVENPNSYAIVLSNGHYAGSPGCESFLQYGDGERVVGMHALAPWRNRPAEVLEALGGNADEIAALKETTKRWLRKQGFDPDDMPAEPAIKDFSAVEVQMPSLFNVDGTARFTVTAKATANDIAKVIVRADGAEIPQSWDGELPVPAGGQKELAVEVPLASGQNWIEVTPVDSKGIAGDTFRFRTIYKGTEKSDLYVIALGVSDYDNPDLKLQYAAKDAADISAALKKYGVGNEKHVLLLTDKQVKDQGVLNKVREFLSAATINDRVVLYVAGHGMLDDKYNYYYAPAGFDPERIAETGITMDELTGCLQGSKARKRLLLLDTCHSGMLGEEGEEKLAMSGVQLPHGVRAIQHRGMKVKKAIGALNTNQKKRYIENLFSRGDIQRGINIIAGAAGAEYALESGEWKNGVFTASIIGAMRGEGAAQDVDGDGLLSVEELQQKIASTVQQQTGGQQKPSIVSAEGVENMLLVEGVGYHKIKQLMTQKNWSQLVDVIRKSPRNYNEGQSEELVSEAVTANAPVEVIRQMLEHGASPQRKYGPALEKFLELGNPEYLAHKREMAKFPGAASENSSVSENSEYRTHRLEIAKLFAQSGDVKLEQGSRYKLRSRGDEELAVVFLEKGVTTFDDPYAGENSLGLFEIFAKHGISPNYTENGLKAGNFKDVFRNILLANQEYRKHLKVLESIRRPSTVLQEDMELLSGTPLHELALLYCDVSMLSQKSEVLKKMQILLEHGANPNCLQGHRIEGGGADGSAATDITPLYILCRNGRLSFQDVLPAIKLLIQHGANIHLPDCNGKEPLDRWDPNYKVLEQLEAAAKSGASMDNIQAVSTAVPTPPTSSYSVGGEDRSDLQPMIDRMAALKCKAASSAMYQRGLLMLLPMIRNGADVNLTLPETMGNTALHYSCAIGSWSITQWLVNHGADVNAVTDKGATPLDCVGSDNGVRIRALLISRGAKRSAELGGGSRSVPVTYSSGGGDRSDLQPMIDRMAALKCKAASSALYQRRLLTLLPLIRDGADVNLTLSETKGNTALHYSCAIGSWSITQWLVNHGANVNAVTDKGATPLDCVGSDNGVRIRALLKSRGAKHASEL